MRGEAVTTANKLKNKRLDEAISALDDYHNTVRSLNAPLARMLRRVSKARLSAQLKLNRVNAAFGSEIELDKTAAEVVGIETYRDTYQEVHTEALRIILSLRSMRRSSNAT